MRHRALNHDADNSSNTMNTLAIMVSRLYVDRVREALLFDDSDYSNKWISISTTADDGTQTKTTAPCLRKRPLGAAPSWRVAPTTITDAPGKKTNPTYILILIENNKRNNLQLAELHPMARQTISWGVTLSHHFIGNANGSSDSNSLNDLGILIYSELMKIGFDLNRDCVRAHTFPKELSAAVCQSLQMSAAADSRGRVGGASSYSIDENHPYDGPIGMTMSKSKCTHVVSVIRHETGYGWNVETKESHFAAHFNHSANDEVFLEPVERQTGKDLSANVVPSAPVSRAYYKLRQVWDEILSNKFQSFSGIGVDLGASPGGWTQVLSHDVGLSKVVAVDKAILAERVRSLPGVVRVSADMSSPEAAAAIEAVGDPISLLVCDACILSVEILERVVELIQRMDQGAWTLPAAFVITLKQPFKTAASINRHLEKVKTKLPSLLKEAVSFMYKQPVKTQYQIRHLMANSDLERTLVVTFESVGKQDNT